jgi:hypothetical protein
VLRVLVAALTRWIFRLRVVGGNYTGGGRCLPADRVGAVEVG